MFVKQEIPNLKTHIERLMKTKGVSYLLHFRGHGHDNTAIIQSLICRFPTHIQKNLQSLFRQKRKWGGCFGISSLISHEGVSDLVEMDLILYGAGHWQEKRELEWKGCSVSYALFLEKFNGETLPFLENLGGTILEPAPITGKITKMTLQKENFNQWWRCGTDAKLTVHSKPLWLGSNCWKNYGSWKGFCFCILFTNTSRKKMKSLDSYGSLWVQWHTI